MGPMKELKSKQIALVKEERHLIQVHVTGNFFMVTLSEDCCLEKRSYIHMN